MWQLFRSAYGLGLLLVLVVGCAEKPETPVRSIIDLESAVSGLLASTADDAFLVVNISGSPDFVQMSAYQGSAELDFPQVTDRQRKLRPKIEEVCRELGLSLRVTRGTDGAEFLDYDLPGDAEQISAMLRRILSEVFGATQTSELEFQTNGFDLPAA